MVDARDQARSWSWPVGLDRLILFLGLLVGQPFIGAIRRLQALLIDSEEDTAESDDPSAPPLIFFESSGLFFPYYLGVAEHVCEHYDTDHVICAGVSGGYAAASTIALGLHTEMHWAAIEGMYVYT